MAQSPPRATAMNPIRHPAAFLPWLMLALAGALATVTGRAADDSDPRFSSTLSPAQLTDTGLDKLSSDNVAVIDALVRMDVATLRVRNNTIRTTRFSQRRTDHERDIAGIDHLTPEQLAKLDQFVALRIPAPLPPAGADLSYASVSLDAVPVPYQHPSPEIHGSFTLTYGWGKGGSVRGADSVVTYVNPARGFALSVGYSQYKGNGLAPYPYPTDGSYSPYYRPAPVIIPEDK
jgi:hypothetical protein